MLTSTEEEGSTQSCVNVLMDTVGMMGTDISFPLTP